MRKIFTLIALGSVALASADQYNQPYGNGTNYYPSCNNVNNGNYNQQNQSSQGYNQRDDYQQQGNPSYERDQQRNNENTYGSQNGNTQRTTSDQEINKKIQETLSSGWFSKGFQNVSFDVNNGNVNLRGSIDTLENKNKVEDSVRKIEGVRSVNNQLQVTNR